MRTLQLQAPVGQRHFAEIRCTSYTTKNALWLRLGEHRFGDSSSHSKFWKLFALEHVMDVVTPAKRSLMMSGIRGKDTKPELAVRKLVHGLGYRFRLHRRDLPGSPDLVLPRLRKVIFVHGCFWHRHPGCRFAYRPKSNIDFWQAKLDGNTHRDAATNRTLASKGWDVLIVWECEVSEPWVLSQKLRNFLTKDPVQSSVQVPLTRQESDHV